MLQKAIVIIGDVNTKGDDLRFLKGWIEAGGLPTFVVNTGVIGEPKFSPEIDSSQVAIAGGTTVEELVKIGDRQRSVECISQGVAEIVKSLYQEGRLCGVISLGGSANTAVAAHAMRGLPLGVPKIIVSSIASGDTRPFIGSSDITMMPSVVDTSGLNRVSRQIYMNAAGAIVGMVRTCHEAEIGDRPCVAATISAVTTPCVRVARQILEEAGYEVLVFHATGIGGQAMESLIMTQGICGVLDITLGELSDGLFGGIWGAGADRLEAAGRVGIPQVVVPGALDMVSFGPPNTVPEKFRTRLLHQHRPIVTIMRTNHVENKRLGELVAEKLNRGRSYVSVVIPKQGFSALDSKGQVFYDPAADAEFAKAVKTKLKVGNVVELDNHINDRVFAETVAHILLEQLALAKRNASQLACISE